MDDNFFDQLAKVDNLHDPEPFLNDHTRFVAFTVTFLVVAWLCGFTRLFVRLFVAKCPWWDDLFVFLAMCMTLVGNIPLCMDQGLGQHLLLMSDELRVEYAKHFYMANFAYPMTTTFIKLALLFQFLRFFEHGTRIRTVTVVSICVVSLWGFLYSTVAIVPRLPLQSYWDMSTPSVFRWGFGSANLTIFVNTYVSHAISNQVLDFGVWAIAVWLYCHAPNGRRFRLSLLFTLLLGGCVNCLSCTRMASIIMTQAGTFPTLDLTFYAPTPIVLSAAEVALAIVCASVPVFWPRFRARVQSVFVTTSFSIEVGTRLSSEDLNKTDTTDPLEAAQRDPYMLRYLDPFAKPEIRTVVEVGAAEAEAEEHTWGRGNPRVRQSNATNGQDDEELGLVMSAKQASSFGKNE